MNIRERSLLKSLSKLNYSQLQWFKLTLNNLMKINGYSKEFYNELNSISDRKELLQEKGIAN